VKTANVSKQIGAAATLLWWGEADMQHNSRVPISNRRLDVSVRALGICTGALRPGGNTFAFVIPSLTDEPTRAAAQHPVAFRTPFEPPGEAELSNALWSRSTPIGSEAYSAGARC
jgi:hypothetical protein